MSDKPAGGHSISPDEVIQGVVPIGLLQPAVVQLINSQYAECVTECVISLHDLERISKKHLKTVFEKAHEKIEGKSVDPHDAKHPDLPDIGADFGYQASRGERIADHVAKFGGSWGFILWFSAILIGWMVINTTILLTRAFDPYPFILLNLCLSALATLQAPLIMMSQNRQEQRERLRSEHDFRVNLRAAIEVRDLSAKVDRLLAHQWERLEEIRQKQDELGELAVPKS
ncbi:MAG: DUF1003 domain-containing protein [bacterium]|nr:DUF1003 domain-containing protein [bacterium]